MNWKNLTVRVGVLAVLAALLLRFAGSSMLGGAWGIFAQPELASFLIYSETGRDPQPSDDATTEAPTQSEPTQGQTQPTEPAPTEPKPTETLPTEPQPTEPEPTQPEPTDPEPTDPEKPDTPALPMFTKDDKAYFEMYYGCAYRPDTVSLLTQKLSWDLTGDEPTVLIIHSHGTEAYTKTEDSQYDNYAAYRTKDDRYNMISIGDELARLLEEQGIHVIHDRTPFDYLDYDNAYNKSRAAVQKYLKEYPSIKLVLDLHRDAVSNADGSQWATSATVNGEDSAQLMLVVGTSAAGESHPNWQTNLSIAEKLNVLMEKEDPGICRPIQLKYKRYNQDLSPGSILVEVGTAGNTHAQAMTAVSALAEAIVRLAYGSQ